MASTIKISTEDYKRVIGSKPKTNVYATWAFGASFHSSAPVLVSGKYADACKAAKAHFAKQANPNQQMMIVYLMA